mmetsp:Transcript_3761/g.9859  ORF Transcript_3761/g.9859 Transcript_3761/m.9859 type:complete len:253 (+) Transcript_3761:133-891(+)
MMKTSIRCAMARLYNKRTAVVQQLQQCGTSQRKQYTKRRLTTTTIKSSSFAGRIVNDENGEERPERHFAFPPAQFFLASKTRSSSTESRRLYHVTSSQERAPAIIMGLATVSAFGFAGASAIKSYNEWKKFQPTKEELEEIRKQEEEDKAKIKSQEQQEDEDDSDKPRTNIFREWFDVGTKYYEGGFEETMTRREAALILGVRESSPPDRVKDAHRRLLILNHPDTGGSNYLAGKLNEAKELLLKGKSQKTN